MVLHRAVDKALQLLNNFSQMAKYNLGHLMDKVRRAWYSHRKLWMLSKVGEILNNLNAKCYYIYSQADFNVFVYTELF